MTEAKHSGTSTEEMKKSQAGFAETDGPIDTEDVMANHEDAANTYAEEQAGGGKQSESTDANEIGNNTQQLTEKISQLEEQIRELENRNIRLQADFDNFKRRSRAEREDLVQFATSRLIQSLLPVMDNLDLALVSGKTASDVASVVKGVEMVARQLNGVLEQEGLTTMQAIGQQFDPNMHEGVMQVEANEEFPAGTVVEELRKGYLLNGKAIRPAMVKVSQ